MSSYLTRPIGPYDHTMGPPDAPYQLLEYGDHECPYCGAAHPIVKSVQRRSSSVASGMCRCASGSAR